MQFIIDVADTLKVTDQELSELLSQVYVNVGFTSKEVAATIFDPSLVRKRGVLFGARDKNESALAGMVIIVPPDSAACRLAQKNEVEMHLLGVKEGYRGYGLGRLLVDAGMEYALKSGYSKMILWTQKTMYAAQHLYESSGFVQTKEIYLNGIEFWVYERELRLTNSIEKDR